jgi:hypothetical protein
VATAAGPVTARPASRSEAAIEDEAIADVGQDAISVRLRELAPM